MSDSIEEKEPTDETEAGEEKLGCLARIIPVTTPGCASFLTIVFLLVTAVTVWSIFWLDPNNIPWRYSYSLPRILGIVLLIVVIPFLVHKTVSIWLEGKPIAFPDVDQAWRAGLHALAANEIAIDSVPIFLITGSSGESQEKAIMNATGLRLSVEGVPQGPAPLHWYANSEAIYLFCTDSSWTSALASLREELASESSQTEGSFDPPAIVQSTFDFAASLNKVEANPAPIAAPQPAISPTPPASVPMPARAVGQNIRGTLELNDFVQPQNSPPPIPPQQASNPNAFRGTLMLGSNGGPSNDIARAPSATESTFGNSNAGSTVSPVNYNVDNRPNTVSSSPTASVFGDSSALTNKKPILVSHQYSNACLQELQYIGQLVRRVREPLCAINGVLTLIQVESIHSNQAELEELQRAIRGDLDTIRSSFRLRVPVSALVVGLEKERGFRELIARVGKERALSQRFGRRFDVQTVPTKDQMVALATHLCGVFEDWAYTLFREENALTRPGNTRLYELLSKVRCGWKGRLGDILSGGFGCDPSKRDEDSSILFSGCYFAATGEFADRQAFVKGVIEKMGEEQELIEWTQEAISANKRQNIAANLGGIVTVALMVTFLAMYFIFR